MGEPFRYYGKMDQTELLWTSSGLPIVDGQAIEIAIETSHPSFLYETYCFDKLHPRLGTNMIALGPHVTDYIFSDNNWREISRPDGLIFETNELFWRLSAMIEIRSGEYKIYRKLAGLANLSTRLRTNPHFIPRTLRDLVGLSLPIPDIIVIPDDPEILVVFVGPSKKIFADGGYGQLFQLQHIQIPNPYTQ